MSSLQAAKDRIIISGTLTANVNLIFPAWIKSWVVHNNCTGNFTVTCRTASGSGVVVIPGLVSRIFCDGVNISDETYNPNNDMVGMVAAFAANAAPTGWLAADGGLISRVTYARLFSRIGTTFGAGDGSTTFALPDMRGEFVRGWDNGRGVDVGRAFGTWQKGSVVVGDDGVAGVNVASSNSPDKSSLGLDPGGSETYPISIAPGANNQLGNQYFGYSRPRNYALLYCIKF
ncbi:phage tail protein [Cronobacter sakazakii]|nr:phage tail protein [Cronobacter sakazakii]ELY4305926.1 tail fiber protein [Cronobacter sakazakii]